MNMDDDVEIVIVDADVIKDAVDGKFTTYLFPSVTYVGVPVVVEKLFPALDLSLQAVTLDPLLVTDELSLASNHKTQFAIIRGSNVEYNFVDLSTVVIISYIKRIVLALAADITNDCPLPGGITKGLVKFKTLVIVMLKYAPVALRSVQ